jgi:stage V sporulation protein R
MADWTLRDLEYWDERIRERALALGLDCFPQEFEICDHQQMLGAMAYAGMPSHYPHWSYGKAFEKLKTLYDYGVSGLPYELVINANPSLAYLMRDNSLLLQILTMAHVYGHNDFFKNNFTFRTTRPEHVLSTFRNHAHRVRSYFEDPSIGVERVEAVLDAAHALSLQCRRNLAIKKLSYEEERERQRNAARPKSDPYGLLHRQPDYDEPDPHKTPPVPEEDLLLFIRDHNPLLSDWQRDLLTIVHEQTQYFIPQIETKIINEGWASFVHREILTSLDLPQELHLEFLVRHNQVLRPVPGGLNPYHLGLKIWDDILKRFGGPATKEREAYDLEGASCALAKLFEVRAADRDASFLRRFLTRELMEELDLFAYRNQGEDLLVSEISDETGWERVKATLLANVGLGSVPVIKVEDAGFGRGRTLSLKHYFDGRELQLDYAEKTLAYLYQLWGSEVVLETVLDAARTYLRYDANGFSVVIA